MLPTAERLEALPTGLCRAIALRGCMTRSVVSVTNPQPHAALGLPAYVQFTSPIRRYSDLLAHYQVRQMPDNRHGADTKVASLMSALPKYKVHINPRYQLSLIQSSIHDGSHAADCRQRVQGEPC